MYYAKKTVTRNKQSFYSLLLIIFSAEKQMILVGLSLQDTLILVLPLPAILFSLVEPKMHKMENIIKYWHIPNMLSFENSNEGDNSSLRLSNEGDHNFQTCLSRKLWTHMREISIFIEPRQRWKAVVLKSGTITTQSFIVACLSQIWWQYDI